MTEVYRRAARAVNESAGLEIGENVETSMSRRPSRSQWNGAAAELSYIKFHHLIRLLGGHHTGIIAHAEGHAARIGAGRQAHTLQRPDDGQELHIFENQITDDQSAI